MSGKTAATVKTKPRGLARVTHKGAVLWLSQPKNGNSSPPESWATIGLELAP